MKRYLFLALMFIIGNLFSAPKPKSFVFRKPILINATTWKFMSVAPGVNAYAIITGSKNATINMIDDSASYAYAWQPNIKYTNTTSNSSDSSYIEFTIKFVNSLTDSLDVQDAVAMTLIDVDGNNNYRELVKTSLPAAASVLTGSQLTFNQDSRWLNTLGTTVEYSGIDTSNYQAMTQINFTNVSSYIIRVGVLGKISAGTDRQHSLYFKPFNAMSVPLDINLINFTAKLVNNNVEANWSATSAENLNRFELYRSTDGINFYLTGTVDSKGKSNEMANYGFTDNAISMLNSPILFYRLKMIDNVGNSIFSNISQVITFGEFHTETISIYPNPTSAYVHVSQTEAIDIAIIDAYGKTLQTAKDSEINNRIIQFDVRNLQNGVYFINILNMDGSATSNKFIKR